jgi:hypothetical protein
MTQVVEMGRERKRVKVEVGGERSSCVYAD